jgi:hypothetical protein
MAWSQMHEGGNSCDASSENTLKNCQYGPRMLFEFRVSLGSIIILPMYNLFMLIVLDLLTCRGKTYALTASGVRNITGNWL